MEGRQESASSRTRRLGVGVLALVVLGATLVLASASSGSTDGKQAAAAKPVVISSGKGFGEVYAAKASTLKHTLFKATLLPKDKASRNIALAGLGRADRKVNEALALRCWKSNGCKTGTGGKLTVAYIEQFGENVYRQMSKMEFILQALTYPQVGQIIYRSAHSDLNQGIADFKAAIAQKVSLIVVVPRLRRRDAAGDEAGDRCRDPRRHLRLGLRDRAWHELPHGGGGGHLRARQDVCVRHEPAGQVRRHRLPGRLPREPAVGGLAEVREARAQLEHQGRCGGADELGSVKVQSVVAGVLAAHPDIKGWSYEYGLGMATGALSAYKAAGKSFDAVLTLRTDDVGMGCTFNQLKNPKLQMYYYTSGNSQIRVAFTAAMMKLKGAKIPPQIVFPIQLQNQRVRDSCVKGYPQEASATSLIPLSLLKKMYP